MTNEELKMCARCQIRWERDKAMEQLEEHHIPFMCVAEDVVEVVRCKDCKLFQPFKGVRAKVNTDKSGWCGINDYSVRADDYCSYGERKDSR